MQLKAKYINKKSLRQNEVTFLSVKRIRSSYQRKILNWLVDSGGSVSQISKALQIRTPHASHALAQLRNKGLVVREDSQGIRGAIHNLTEFGRLRLEQDYLSLYQKFSSNNTNGGDAVVLDSKGSIILLGYVNNPPKALICLPDDPYMIENLVTTNSSGNVGVRWASVQSESIKWYSADTLEQIQPQKEITKGTLDDWFEKTNSFAIVRANLFDPQNQWNVTAGTWFKTPEFTENDLPNIISSGDNLIGNVVDSTTNIFWNNRLHAHLNSNIDVSMLINSFSRKAVLLRNNVIKSKSIILPIGCLRIWLRYKHQRMTEKRLDDKYSTICEFILKNRKTKLSISILRDLSRDFGDCEWVQEIPNNIEVSNLSLLGMKSLVKYMRQTSINDFVVEWNWSISENLEFLEYVLNAETCRLLISKRGEYNNINSASGYLISQPNLAEVKLIISREHSLNIQLTSGQEKTPDITHQSIPSSAKELLDSYSDGAWSLEQITGFSADFEYRKEIWQACYMYPLGDEQWANNMEYSNPLASWIASPNENRPSRWTRVSKKLDGKWADLIDFTELDVESIFFSLVQAGEEWQKASMIYISERFIENNELIIHVSHLIDDDDFSSLFSASLLLASNQLPSEFQSLILQAIDYWIDTPLFVMEILEALFVSNGVEQFDRYGVLDRLIKASQIHPQDSILYNWGQYVVKLSNKEVINNEQMRIYMQLFPCSWWYNKSSEWLLNQLATSSGRRWLTRNHFPWPALIARLDGESCGPPGFLDNYTKQIPNSTDLIYIPMMEECRAKEPLMDLYEMVISHEEGVEMTTGRTHPLVGLLLKDILKWPKISYETIFDGDKEIGGLLFGISFHNGIS